MDGPLELLVTTYFVPNLVDCCLAEKSFPNELEKTAMVMLQVCGRRIALGMRAT